MVFHGFENIYNLLKSEKIATDLWFETKQGSILKYLFHVNEKATPGHKIKNKKSKRG